MITRYITGDITETELKYIAHGVNCQNKMGSGVAKALYTKWNSVKYHYHQSCKGIPPEHLLGLIHGVLIPSDNKTVFNMFTQLQFGYDGKRYVNYEAVARCFNKLVRTQSGITLAIPKIGCGLAGGNWTFMEQLINDTVGDKLEIWVYELETKSSGKNDVG